MKTFKDAYQMRDDEDAEGLLQLWESSELALAYLALAIKKSGHGDSVYTEVRRFQQLPGATSEWQKVEAVLGDTLRKRGVL